MAEQLQYIGTRFLLFVIPLFPRKIILLLARIGGNIAYSCSAKLRRVGHANLDHVYKDQKTENEKKLILKKMFRNFALMGLDLLWFSKNTRKRMKKYIIIEEELNFLKEDYATFILTGHYGNWEIIGQALNIFGTPIASIAAPLKNKKVDKLFLKIREESGQEIFQQEGAMRKMFATLKKKGNVALLLDQNTLLRDGGIFVDFFGLPAPVSSAPAAILKKTNAHLAVVFCTPEPGGKYRGFLKNVIAPLFSEMSLEELTRIMTNEICEQIMERPECWMWVYKRWKFIPEGKESKDYPYYARSLKEHEK